MKYKNRLIYIILSISITLISGCNHSQPTDADVNLEDTTTEEISTEPTIELTEPIVTTVIELTIQEKLNNTCWAGSDGNGNIFSISFDENQISVTSNGYRSDISGFWEVDDEKVSVYSDETLTDMITYYDYTLYEFDNGNSIMYMEDLYLSKLDNNTTDFETICEEINLNFYTLSTISDGSYWVGYNDLNVDFFVCNYGDIYLYVANFNSSDTIYYDGKWGITSNNGIYIKDNQSGDFTYFNWEFNEITSKLYLTDMDGNTLEFYKTEASSFNEAIAIVNSHLDGSYVEETTTTEETTFEETTTEETSIVMEETDIYGNLITTIDYNNIYFNNPDDVNLNPDDENYDDYAEYFDNYTKEPENLYPQYNTTQAPTYDYDYNDGNSYDYNNDIYGF